MVQFFQSWNFNGRRPKLTEEMLESCILEWCTKSMVILFAGSAGDVLEDNPVGRLKVFIYDIPR